MTHNRVSIYIAHYVSLEDGGKHKLNPTQNLPLASTCNKAVLPPGGSVNSFRSWRGVRFPPRPLGGSRKFSVRMNISEMMWTSFHFWCWSAVCILFISRTDMNFSLIGRRSCVTSDLFVSALLAVQVVANIVLILALKQWYII